MNLKRTILLPLSRPLIDEGRSYQSFFFSEYIFTRKKGFTKEITTKIETIIQDISTLKGAISFIFKVYKDCHSSPCV